MMMQLAAWPPYDLAFRIQSGPMDHARHAFTCYDRRATRARNQKPAYKCPSIAPLPDRVRVPRALAPLGAPASSEAKPLNGVAAEADRTIAASGRPLSARAKPCEASL